MKWYGILALVILMGGLSGVVVYGMDPEKNEYEEEKSPEENISPKEMKVKQSKNARPHANHR